MSARTRRRLTDAEREQQRARERELTIRAVEQLRTSARLASVAARPRPHRPAALQRRYLGAPGVAGDC